MSSFTDKKLYTCFTLVDFTIVLEYFFIIIIPKLHVMQEGLRKNKCSALEHVDNIDLEVNFEPCIFLSYIFYFN